ncbi:uncharacterized protein LW93_5723 [Fusarium fujikuroi]|nr:uncharacterized protein LW93_5723 [Fusarium fujikuroi]SCV37155.1 uncharacterized protein FFB14_06460 [Fusarium fujikuroi]
MLAPIRAPLANHDTTAPPTNIPCLAAPAAVPGLVLGLKGAVGEWTLGQRVARRRRVWDGLLGRVAAGAAAREADWTQKQKEKLKRSWVFMYPKYLPAFPDLSLNRLSLPFHQDAISATPTAIEPEGGHGCKISKDS